MGVVKEGLAQSRLVTLVGLPGVGKSRLAAAVCDAHDGWLMMNLSQRVTPDAVERAFAQAGLNVCLFLDNYEECAAAFNPVLQVWFHRYPGLRVLLTSRRRTGLAGEWVYEVAPLALADACELLRHLTESANPRLRSIVPAVTIAALAKRVGGIPLAIEWLAHALRVHEPQQLANVENLVPYLLAPQRDEDPSRGSMAAVFEEALFSLSTDARRVLQALCIFEGGFSTAMAAELLDVPNDHEQQLCLGELVDAAVMINVEIGESKGFAIHSLLREHVRLTTDVQMRQELQRRLGRWARNFVESALRVLSPHQFMQHLQAQEDNLLQVITADASELAVERKNAVVGDQLLRLLIYRGELQRAHQLATDLLARGQPGYVDEGRARLLLERAKIAIRGGDLHGAAADLEQVPQHNDEVKVSRLEVQALLARRRGDVQTAEACYGEAMAVSSQQGDIDRAAAIMSERAAFAFEIRDIERAKGLFQEAKDAMRAAGRPPDPKLLTNMALLFQEEGALLQAEQTLQQALALHTQAGNRRFMAITLGDLANLAFEQGCAAKAAELYTSAEAAPADAWDMEQLALIAAARSASLTTLHPNAANVTSLKMSSIAGGIKPAVATYLALERYLNRCKAGQWHEAEQGLAEELGHITGHPWTGMRDEIRLALRIAQHYRHANKLLVCADGSGFCTTEDKWIDLRRRPLLGRLLVALATNRLQEATGGLRTCDLVDRGWPGERMREDAAANRLYVALSELRKLGLSQHFSNTRERYRLSEQTAVLVCAPVSL